MSLITNTISDNHYNEFIGSIEFEFASPKTFLHKHFQGFFSRTGKMKIKYIGLADQTYHQEIVEGQRIHMGFPLLYIHISYIDDKSNLSCNTILEINRDYSGEIKCYQRYKIGKQPKYYVDPCSIKELTNTLFTKLEIVKEQYK
jgi:hypothetical protein